MLVSCISARPLALQLGQKPLPVRGASEVVFSPSSCRKRACLYPQLHIKQGSQYLLQGKGDTLGSLEQPLNKGLLAGHRPTFEQAWH
jgi:hypothetical protein